MNETVELFMHNDEALKKGFKWENNLNRKFAALELTLRKKEADVEEIKRLMAFMKKETSAFSYFRSSLLTISASLSAREDREETFRKAVSLYEDLKAAGFSSTQYLPYVAYFLAAEADGEAKDTIARAYEMYKVMKQNNYWLTSADDHMMATLLAHSGVDPSTASVEMKEIYEYLNEGGIRKGNVLQGMSHLLLISNEPVYKKADRLLSIRQGLKDADIKLDSYSQSMIAVLALVKKDQEINKAIEQIGETSRFLEKQNGFGNWTLGKGIRNMLSIALVISEDLDGMAKDSVHTTVQNSIQSILLAQQAVMIGAVSASAASSSSSGN